MTLSAPRERALDGTKINGAATGIVFCMAVCRRNGVEFGQSFAL